MSDHTQKVEGPLVLLPGGDADARRILTAILESQGYTVTEKTRSKSFRRRMLVSRREEPSFCHHDANRITSPETGDVESSGFSLYGSKVLLLPADLQDIAEMLPTKVVDVFCAAMEKDPLLRTTLHNLDEDALDRLKMRHVEYLRLLLDPAATRDMVWEKARWLGQISALTGVDFILLTRSISLYRRIFTEQLSQSHLPVHFRKKLMLTVEMRLQEAISAELQGSEDTRVAYFESASAPLPERGTPWTDAIRTEIDALGGLPGVIGVGLIRPNSLGEFVLEYSGGPKAAEAYVLNDPQFKIVLDRESPRGHGLITEAWRNRQLIITSADYLNDPRVSHWHGLAKSYGFRSMLAVPVLDEANQPLAVLGIYGRYVNQFESSWMRQWARSTQQRWSFIWQRTARSVVAEVLHRDIALELREQLFAGGLRMYMQPVVDLHTDRLVRTEALARLKMPDDRILTPAAFLPLLGSGELDRLFRLGLHQALRSLANWENRGLVIKVSVNLPPTTLFNAECPHWVDEALRHNNLDPGCLILELLETQSMEHGQQTDAIRRLKALGVGLAMDDLGSGYSSLVRLSELPFGTIGTVKMDQKLVAKLRHQPGWTLRLMAAIIQIGGRDSGLDVVVEGLENPGMIEAAAIMGAPFGQGYGLARPMPAESIVEWYRNFKLPIEPGKVHTFVGALAYHHKLTYFTTHGLDLNSPESPMTRFLAENKLQEWPIALGQDGGFQGADRSLGLWLEDRVRKE